ncbi:hypothetical protein K458DRAFT_392018 [Lentithecium fluviatile CBS 122367]|uniref:RING-type domain-containing protein n=1 Tax=Lentithecium fluviatile CBS 122367 TaxID=1168545 RepID=A0A6G1IST7_9PLEO|nr:hypothetical protein K458DRAFT_392018 [Lentithecium fluviatile CBS 122367]
MELVVVRTLAQGQEKICEAAEQNIFVSRDTYLEYLKSILAPDGEKCAICQDVFTEAPIDVVETLQCRHPFHRGCIMEWFRSSNNQRDTCPQCRTVLYKVQPLTPGQATELNALEGSRYSSMHSYIPDISSFPTRNERTGLERAHQTRAQNDTTDVPWSPARATQSSVPEEAQQTRRQGNTMNDFSPPLTPVTPVQDTEHTATEESRQPPAQNNTTEMSGSPIQDEILFNALADRLAMSERQSNRLNAITDVNLPRAIALNNYLPVGDIVIQQFLSEYPTVPRQVVKRAFTRRFVETLCCRWSL